MTVREQINNDFLYYFDQGQSLESYKVFGAHLVKDESGKNVACEFCLYAPNAARVELVGDFNNFERGRTELFCVDSKGVWYARIEGNYEWNKYKYVITTKDGRVLYKQDPYGFFSEIRPSTDSKVYDINGYQWKDDVWMFTHPKVYDKPCLIYELHLGSWRRKPDGTFNQFSDIAPMLIKYLSDYGYTHVEVMPVYEHPLDASWGYQGTGYYSVSARYGAPKDFMWFVDQLHQAGYGVIMDWVPGHICKDAQGLYMFDGTPLYDYPNEQDRENKEWGTANLDLGKGVTRSFLYSNAMFYLNYFHVDGFRLDAVSNMIYWLGNVNRGVNEGACEFLRNLSTHLFAKDDRIILSAEDSSNFPHVTLPSTMGGLGFNFKWDMGWMNDTLKYFKEDPIYRSYDHYKLTFSMMYYYNEQFILPFSHDEVVHMKGSLLNKMPGDRWQQFANYRLLLGYMMTHPGKKLLFMGNELASYDEWHFESELPWNISRFPDHDAAQRYVRELTRLYKSEPAFWECDYKPAGFNYIDADNTSQSLYIYARFAENKDDHIVVVMNCTPNTYDNYRIGVPGNYEYTEVMNSDRDIYNGSNRVNPYPLKAERYSQNNRDYSILMTIPPLGVSILKATKKLDVPKVTEAPAAEETKTAPAKKKTTGAKTAKKTLQ